MGGSSSARGVAQVRRSIGPSDDHAMLRQELHRRLDRGPRGPPEPSREVVDAAGAVEQRQERRQERLHGGTLEDDDRLRVLEQEPLAVADDAVPGREQGQCGDCSHSRQHPSEQQQQQQSTTIANSAEERPRTPARRSSRSCVSAVNISRTRRGSRNTSSCSSR